MKEKLKKMNQDRLKVLWLCNIPIPKIAKSIGLPGFVTGGWLEVLSEQLLNSEHVSLAISFPLSNIEKMMTGKVGKCNYYAIPRTKKSDTKYEKNVEEYYKEIIHNYEPDIIHIWGTEFPRTLSMINVCEEYNMLDQTIIDIQGLCSIIEKHCLASLPNKIVKRKTFRDFVKNDSIKLQQKKYCLRGKYEVLALKKAKHVIGRTNWDIACIKNITQSVNYYSCNRILRNEFYNNKWQISKCKKYSILINQGAKPLKGLHYVLEALFLVLKSYPNTQLCIAGKEINKKNSLIEKLKISSYDKYIYELIEKYRLEDKIIFLGPLEERKMCQQYLESHVFVSASSIENSPNSVGEAMILGVPTISSYVGGVSSMLDHNREGFLYQHDAPYMLAYYIKKIFGDKELAEKLSDKARDRAIKTHDMNTNFNRMMQIYRKVLKEQLNE